ncbi:MAG: murein biosynthesis integral membrane protein MurJ [Steroidobacteraceae bacterium]
MSGGFFRSTSIVGAFTLISRVTGLLRDMVYSRMFGAGVLMDAFLVAFKIPNFMRRLFAEGAFSQAFVPVVSEYKVQRPHDEVRELIDGAAGTLAWFLSVVTIVGVIAAPLLVLLFAPGFHADEGKFDLTVEMLRWTFPYLLFISLAALAAGVLNSYGKFAIPATTSTVMNLIMIVFAAWIAPRFDNPGVVLAIGVFVAGLAQLVFQVPAMLKLGLLRRPRWRWGHEGVRKIGRLMLPAIFGSSVSQVALLLDTLIASFLATGSIAWLYYADRLMEFPLGVFSIALATVILPGLAAHHAAASPERFTATLDWAIRLTVVVVLPATLALVVLAGPMTVTIFHYGKFDEHDVRMASLALMAYSSGLLAFSMVKVLAPGFFARQDTRTPVRIGIQALAVNMGLNLVIVLPLALIYDLTWLHALLALNNGIGAWYNSIMLYRGLRRQGVLHHAPGWRRLWLQVLAGNVLMVAFLSWLGGETARWIEMGAWQRAQWMALLVVGGAGIYFGTLYVLGMRVGDLRVKAFERLSRPS